MKNRTMCVILSAVCLLLAGCSNNGTNSNSGTSTTSNMTTTVTTEQTEMLDSLDSQLNSGIWKLKYFIDEFNDPDPNNPYISSGMIDGTFSNSATTNDKLLAKIIYTESGKVNIFLYEYGTLEVTNTYSIIKKYVIKIKTEDGNSIRDTGTMNSVSGDRIFADNSANRDILKYLSNGETIKIYIEELERPSTNYLFSVDGKGFKEVYDEYMSKVNS